MAVDELLARRARPQHGVLTHAQLLEAGLHPRAISYRVRIGRLQRLHRGVYAVGHVPDNELTRACAAVLACGEGAALSHRSAAAAWAIVPHWPAAVDVTVAAGRARRPGIVTHRPRVLEPGDVRRHRGIAITSPARTLLDLAEVLEEPALRRAVNQARVARLVRRDELAALLERGRRAAPLRAVIRVDEAPTRSALEDLFLMAVERHRLPRPEVNQRLHGYEVDMLWRRERLVVELDGRAYHEHDQEFERDRVRDMRLVKAGYRVVRLTWRRLKRDAAGEMRSLAEILANDPT